MIIFYSKQEHLGDEAQQIIDFTLTEFMPILKNLKDNKHDFIFEESVIRAKTQENNFTILLGEPLIKKIINDQEVNKN